MMTMAISSSFASRLVLCIAPALSFLFVSSITTSYAAPIHLSPYDGRSTLLMFIQLHVICIFVLFMKHQDVHNDWFMLTKVSYVWINLGYCRDICLRISRAVAVTRICKCRHLRALAPKYRLLWKKPPWWYFHVFQWRSHCSRLASLKGCSWKVVGGWAVTPLPPWS